MKENCEAFAFIGVPDTFWAKLAEALKEKGYTVYCNSGGLDYDKLIEGTIECVLSTKELIINAPLFKHVIGMRSGFTDLVAKTKANLTAIHLGGMSDEPLRIECA